MGGTVTVFNNFGLTWSGIENEACRSAGGDSDLSANALLRTHWPDSKHISNHIFHDYNCLSSKSCTCSDFVNLVLTLLSISEPQAHHYTGASRVAAGSEFPKCFVGIDDA